MTATPNPQLQNAVSRLFMSWLRECQDQAAAYLAGNGDGVDAPTLAQACPAMMHDAQVAAWVLANGHRARVDTREG